MSELDHAQEFWELLEEIDNLKDTVSRLEHNLQVLKTSLDGALEVNELWDGS